MLDARNMPGCCKSACTMDRFINIAREQGYALFCDNLELEYAKGDNPDDKKFRISFSAHGGSIREREIRKIETKRVGRAFIPVSMEFQDSKKSFPVEYQADYLIFNIEWEDDTDPERKFPEIIILRKRLPWDIVTNEDKELLYVVAEAESEYGNGIMSCSFRNISDMRIHSLENGLVRPVTADMAFPQ